MKFSELGFGQRLGLLLLLTYLACIPLTLVGAYSEGRLSFFNLAGALGAAIIPFTIGLIVMLIFRSRDDAFFCGLASSLVFVGLASYGVFREAGLIAPGLL